MGFPRQTWRPVHGARAIHKESPTRDGIIGLCGGCVKKIAKRIWEKCPDRWDVLLVVGLVAFSVGLNRVAGAGITWMFVGVIVVAMAIAGARIKWDT